MKRIIAALLMAAVLTGEALAATIQDVQQRLAETKAEMEAAQEQIARALAEEGVLSQELAEIMAAIRASEGAIVSLNEQIREIQAQIEATQAEIQAVGARKAEREEILRRRIRSGYTGERTGVWQSLLSSRTFDEFAAKRVYLDRLARQDQQVIEALRQDRAELDEAHARLSAREEELRIVLREQQDLLADLRAQEDRKQVLLANARMEQEAAHAALASLEEISAELERELARLIAEEQRRRRGTAFSGSLMAPLDSLEITDPFGMRIHPISGVESMHYGTDFAGYMGQPIYAAADGEVILAEWYGGYGNAVVIDHGGGVSTLYGHASALLVSRGQRVQKGDIIARVGSTGVSTGPHLHFEVRIYGEAVDPMDYLW